MKKSTPILCLSAFVLFSACNFSAGVKTDLSNGLTYSYNGFSVEEAFLVDSTNTPMSSNEVGMNSTVAIILQGITNYELKDDKAFPGLSLSVTGKDGTAVLDEADLFADSEGYSAQDAAILRGKVTVGDPMVPGATYHIKMKVWDKNKPENEITAEVDIIVN